MQRDRWKANAAEAYRNPGVRVRKRLVTAAAKLRKLADTDLALVPYIPTEPGILENS